MHLFMKFILAPVLFVLSVFVIIQTYRKYKIKHLLKKWEKKYHPSLEKGSLRFRLPFFDMMICLYILENISSFYFLTLCFCTKACRRLY